MVSPGADACSTAASESKGARRDPLPPGEAVALTYNAQGGEPESLQPVRPVHGKSASSAHAGPVMRSGAALMG